MSIARLVLSALFMAALLIPVTGCNTKQADSYQKTDRTKRETTKQEDMSNIASEPNIENIEP